jgi:hypothetical protein
LAPVAELDSAGAVVSRFVYATRENVPDYIEKNGQTYRLVLGHLGSVRLVLNASNDSVVQRLDYHEFGVHRERRGDVPAGAGSPGQRATRREHGE